MFAYGKICLKLCCKDSVFLCLQNSDGMRYLVNRAFSVMVAVNEKERPVPIPGLLIRTEAEKGRHEAAVLRREMRKERRDAGF